MQSGRYYDARAHALRERYHMMFDSPELPVPVESIAEDLLGLVVHESPDLAVSGMLVPAEREIWLNASERDRQGRPRFTLAHEIGHWICHCLTGRDKPVYCREKDLTLGADRALEREANIFAAELLMPEELVRAHWARTPDGTSVAGDFRVSLQAMEWRLFNLGLAETRPA